MSGAPAGCDTSIKGRGVVRLTSPNKVYEGMTALTLQRRPCPLPAAPCPAGPMVRVSNSTSRRGDVQSTGRDDTARTEVSSRRGGRSVEEALKMISRKRINQYLLKNWTEILLIPLIPSVFSLITVLFGTIILNTAALDCVQPLGSFLATDVVFAYLILLGYTWLLIGPIPVQSLFNVALVMVSFGFVLFFFYVVGSGLLGASSPCADTAPALYRFTQFKVACFWIGFLVTVGYIVKHVYRWKTRAQRRHAERVLDNERKVARMQEDEEDD